jgi:LysM repeat protein
LLFFGQASAVQPAEANNAALTNSSAKNFIYVTVMSGDSLWAIAERHASGRDPRDFIQDVVSLNNLSDTVVSAGMRLAIPRS